jgi:hypothetical protein
MHLRTSLLALPLILSLSGCFEDSGSSSSSTPQNPAATLTALEAWAAVANLNLPGDAILATSANFTRWDSVVNLVKYQSQARADLARITADWSSRDPVASGWRVVASQPQSGGTLSLVSFSVDNVDQGGLVWMPSASGKHPVVLFGHPDDSGITAVFLSELGSLLGPLDSQVVIVAPAYRGEMASMGTDSVLSDAAKQSPWDRDVDDGLAFLQATLDHFPQADASRIAAVGYSRGAGVSLISAFRDARIHSVFEIAGPTDFFAPSIQRIAVGLMDGQSFSLPGLDYIDANYLQPFQSGKISADSLRRELLERSPARFALSGFLPTTEAVHGTADSTVNPDQSAALKAADPRVTYLSIAGMTHTSFFTTPTEGLNIAGTLRIFLGKNLSLN